jgi:signal transduction histidine kinase
VPLSIDTVEDFWQQSSREAFGYGLFFAVLLAMCVYNFFLYLIIHDRAYLYYVGYLLGITVFLASMSGYAKLLLWPNSTSWAHLAPITAATLAICAGAAYIKLLTRADRFAPLIDRSFKVLAPLGILVIVTNYFAVRPAIVLVGLLMITMLTMVTIAIVRSARAGYKPGQVLLLGIALMFPGALIYYLRTIGVIEENWLSNNILFFTTTGEAMIMSIALAYRIEALNQEVDAHRKTTLDLRINFSRDLIKAIDSERRNIARELHDGLGQGLLAIKSMVNRVDNSEIKSASTSIIRNLISDIRNMARNMHPQQIENLGFSTALETMLTETITPAGSKLNLQLEDVSGKLSMDQELHLYRIAQECASNIVRHADAEQVDVKLRHKEGTISLTICDNGKGLGNQNKDGLGIFSIHERAAIIGATAAYSEAQGGGTVVTIEVQQA